jgi:hypothetical protein
VKKESPSIQLIVLTPTEGTKQEDEGHPYMKSTQTKDFANQI